MILNQNSFLFFYFQTKITLPIKIGAQLSHFETCETTSLLRQSKAMESNNGKAFHHQKQKYNYNKHKM